MARRPTPSPKQTAQLTVEQMKTGIARIQRRIHDLEAFDPTQLQERWAPEVKALERSIEETLELVFGRETTDYDRYMAAASLDSGPIIMGGGRNPIHEVHSFYEEGKRSCFAPTSSEGP